MLKRNSGKIIGNIVERLETLDYVKVIRVYGKTNKYQIVKYLDYKYNEIIEESKNESSEELALVIIENRR